MSFQRVIAKQACATALHLGRFVLVPVLAVFLAAQPGLADAGVKFHDIAADGGAGLVYHRTASNTSTLWDGFVGSGILTGLQLEDTPNKWRGAPGVAVLDYDGDGDLDLYVTNGPGTANSLFSNQWVENGELEFVDVGAASGVGAVDQDSSGVCFGDIDNDGDRDLLVVSPFDPNRLFANNGDGTFSDVTATSGLGGEAKTSVGCSFGDVDGDGLLDVAVANNTVDWSNLLGIGPTDPFIHSQHNQLFLNGGGNVFVDVSASSGLLDTEYFPQGFDGGPSATWAIAMVDYDLDGDVDIVSADDQGGVPRAENGGVNRGLIHIFQNDGAGVFEDVTLAAGLNEPGMWMGLSFGDVNGDGYLDLFGTNVGDWAPTTFAEPDYGGFATYELGASTSRWFLGGEDGTFTDPGVGELVATPFGWGTSMVDYDNDADTDIIFHGGLAFPPTVTCDNPGAMLNNDGAGNFSYDLAALAESTDHRRRTVHGMAVGDLDDDGFSDIVSVSNFDAQDSIGLFTYSVMWGSPLDGLTLYQRLFVPTETFGVWAYSGDEDNVDGTLSVEINSADNGHRWAKVKLLGATGLVTDGRVNRDGIGAMVTFVGPSGDRTMRPVTGGSSYASQDSLELVFGLGSESSGTVEVLWPGGVRNRLRDVGAGERIVFPEIPCDYRAQLTDRAGYVRCVDRALDQLVAAGILDLEQRRRFFESAFECEAGLSAICLNDRRFEVEVDWKDFDGSAGSGQVVPVESDDSGLFWFFGPESWELHVKVLDGCDFNGRFWVYAGASTDVEFTLRVTDTVDGSSKSYFNPLGERAVAITDTDAFATCP